MAKEGYKVCAKCKIEQSVTQFCKNKRAKDGLQSYCRVCSGKSSAWSHGQKRADMQDLRKSMRESELGYKYAEAMMKIKHAKALAQLKKKYEMGGFDVSEESSEYPDNTPRVSREPGKATAERLALFRDTQKRLEKINGKTKSSTAEGAEDEPVRGTESQGVSHP